MHNSPYPRRLSHLFSHLLSPLRVGTHTLRNRVIMGSMHTRLEFLDHPREREAAFYAERARGGVALVVSAGCSPNREGCLEAGAHFLSDPAQVAEHRPITAAVHAEGAKMVLQILHAGRYARHPEAVAPSPLRAPINRNTPRALSEADIQRTLADYVQCARLAREAGYDGVEIMGSEGYLIAQFLARRTNQREDAWGGPLAQRLRFPVAIVAGIRAALGPDFLILFRLSALDLVENGLTGPEIDQAARALEAAGVDILSTGIGWHEATIPTISHHLPRAPWRFAVARLKAAVGIPVVASNRINTPAVAEELLAAGDADLVALARPLLADPDFVVKAARGELNAITPCIACNQACLDFIFSAQPVSCLVNPRAGREFDMPLPEACPTPTPRHLLVVGAGPAGLACALTAARRGHRVTLADAAPVIGGQLQLARRVPHKQEFDTLLQHFAAELRRLGVVLRTGTPLGPADILGAGYDRVIIATGSRPRLPDIPGIDHPKVASYQDVLSGRRALTPGQRVIILGTGGIAHDVADFLLQPPGDPTVPSLDSAAARTAFLTEWGIDLPLTQAGGLGQLPPAPPPRHAITLFQRGSARPGSRLGLTTGWVLRRRLADQGVKAVTGATYLGIDDAGLHYRLSGDAPDSPNSTRVQAADCIILCTGQEPEHTLADALKAAGLPCQLIGGARLATDLDARRAMDEGMAAGMAAE